VEIVQALKAEANNLGFAAIGFSELKRPVFFDQFCLWVDRGKNGDMAWLNRNVDIRENPEKLLYGCKTIISLAYPYSTKKPGTPDGFTAARYTEPKKRDYHYRLRKLGKRMVSFLKTIDPSSRSRVCVDSAPILERSFAYTSGIGFIGKNNMLIVPGFGSYVFLVEILTTIPIDFPDISPMESRCGSCTRCMDACPTGALESPYSIDARRCLSYLTIENNDALSPEAVKRMKNCFLGCDVCQEACPFNRDPLSVDVLLPSAREFLSMSSEEFKNRLGKTAFGYAGLDKIKRNLSPLYLMAS